MRSIFILALILIFSNALGQNYNHLSSGFNLPFKYDNDVHRKLGFEVGVVHGFCLDKHFFIETGITLDFWGRLNKKDKVYFPGSFTPESIQSKFIIANLDLPLLVNYRINKFDIRNGISIYFQNIFNIHSKQYNNIDPEINSDIYPYSLREIGIAYHLKISYLLNQKYSIYADFKTPVIGTQGKRYGLLNLGLTYNIACH